MPAEDQGLVDKCYRLDTNVYEGAEDTTGSSSNSMKTGTLNEWHYGAADSVLLCDTDSELIRATAIIMSLKLSVLELTISVSSSVRHTRLWGRLR